MKFDDRLVSVCVCVVVVSFIFPLFVFVSGFSFLASGVAAVVLVEVA